MFTVRDKGSDVTFVVYDIDKSLSQSDQIRFLVYLDNKWEYVDADIFEECLDNY